MFSNLYKSPELKLINSPETIKVSLINKILVAISVVIMLFFTYAVNAQNYPEPSGWIRAGNCWVAEPGFLYCGSRHPYSEENPDPFLSFACFQHYRAVLLSHPEASFESKARTINSDFGILDYSDIWVATSETESFMSNNVSAANDGYVNILKGLSNPNSKHFKFSVTPGNLEGTIPLVGLEHQAVNAYIDLCEGNL